MAATPALAALAVHPTPHRVHQYHPDPTRRSPGRAAAEALGIAPERVFKTLLARVDGLVGDRQPGGGDVGPEDRPAGAGPVQGGPVQGGPVEGGLVVAVVPVTGELDLRALAAAVGAKRAAMADPAVAERSSGYVVGGISPLGQRRRLPTVIDEQATQWPTVFVSAGRRGLEIELTPADLVALTGARLARLSRSARRPGR